MSEQYLGGFISKTAPTVQANSAQGIWTLTQLSQFKKAGTWPISINAPGAPTIGTVSIDSTGFSAIIPFTAPSSNGGSPIISYTAKSSPGNLTGTVNQANSGSITITGLTANTYYTFTVTDSSIIGPSAPSANSNSVRSATVPGAPTIGTATLTYNNTIIIPFTAPSSNGGNSIISYTSTSNTGGFSNTANQSGSGSISVSGLTSNVAYSFVISCRNYAGVSANSASSNVILVTHIPVFSVPALMGNNTSVYGSADGVAVNSSGTFVAVGSLYSNAYPIYSKSTDGVTWSIPATISNSALTLTAIAVNSSGTFVAVGYNASVQGMYTISTNGGTTWSTPSLFNGSTTTWMPSDICCDKFGVFYVVGTNTSSKPMSTKSSDGSNWATPSIMAGTTLACTMAGVIAYDYGGPIAVGYKSGNVGIYSSYNGNGWSEPQTFTGSPAYPVASIAVNNSTGLYIGLGLSGGFFVRSTDGITWSNNFIGGSQTSNLVLNDITVNSSGLFVAVGYLNSLPVFATTTDGITWSAITTIPNSSAGVNYMLQSIVANGSNFVAVGDSDGTASKKMIYSFYS